MQSEAHQASKKMHVLIRKLCKALLYLYEKSASVAKLTVSYIRISSHQLCLGRDYVRGGAEGALAPPPRNLRVQKGEQKEKQTIHY